MKLRLDQWQLIIKALTYYAINGANREQFDKAETIKGIIEKEIEK